MLMLLYNSKWGTGSNKKLKRKSPLSEHIHALVITIFNWTDFSLRDACITVNMVTPLILDILTSNSFC